MSPRIDSSRSAATSLEEVDTTPHTQRPSKSDVPNSRDSVESFNASKSKPATAQDVGASAPDVTAGELASQQQKYLRYHQLLTDGFSSVKPQFDEAAGGDRNAMLALAVRLSTRPEVARMLNEVPREWVEKGVEAMLRDARRTASPSEVRELKKAVCAQLDAEVRTETAQKLKTAVVAKLETAATQFERDAKNPQMLATMSSQLQKWESADATPRQRELAASARALLDLPDGPVSTEQLATALESRAKLIRHEAQTVLNAGETTLYRSLALHSALGDSLLKAQGIKPDSWAAEGLAQVKAKAARDEGDIAAVKTATNLAFGFVSGAMGFDKATSAAAPVLLNAGGLANSQQQIGRAVAGELAGTASDTAVASAKVRFNVEAAEVGVAAAFSGVTANGHGDVGHGVQHFVAEAVLADSAHAVEHWLHPHGTGGPSTTMNALRGNE